MPVNSGAGEGEGKPAPAQVDSRLTKAPGMTTVGARGCLWAILRQSWATTVRAMASTSTRWVVRGGLQMVE